MPEPDFAEQMRQGAEYMLKRYGAPDGRDFWAGHKWYDQGGEMHGRIYRGKSERSLLWRLWSWAFGRR